MDGFEPCQVRGFIHRNHEHSTLCSTRSASYRFPSELDSITTSRKQRPQKINNNGSWINRIFVRPLMTRSKAVSDRLSWIGTRLAPGGSFAAREEACQSYLTHYPCPRDAQPSNATGPSTPPSRDHDINDLVKRASPPPSTSSTNPILVVCPDPNPSVS